MMMGQWILSSTILVLFLSILLYLNLHPQNFNLENNDIHIFLPYSSEKNVVLDFKHDKWHIEAFDLLSSSKGMF